MHTKVVEAFEVFDHENNKTVDVREIGTIVRSLGHCPSESQLQEIISQMEDQDQMGYIHLDRFLPVMSRYKQGVLNIRIYNTGCPLADNTLTGCPLNYDISRIILQQKFMPAPHEDLLAAFRTLDPENTGQLSVF